MKTQKIILIALTLMAFVFAKVPAMGQNKTANDSIKKDTIIYTCPMHPEVISDKPGKCPKCGMDLVQKNSSSSEHKMDMMMMCPMHGMMPMDHKHDEKKKDSMKMMKGMGIAMGAMMVVMMTIMIIIISSR